MAIEVHDGTKPDDARRWVLAGDEVIGEVHCTKQKAMAIAAGPDLLVLAVRLSKVLEQLADGWRELDATYVDQLLSSELLACNRVIDKAEGVNP